MTRSAGRRPTSPPTGTFNAPSSQLVNTTFSISLTSPVDPSTVDAGSLHYAFDCGTGYGTHLNYATSSTTSSATCTATAQPHAGGSITVKGKIFDKDGGLNEYTAVVTILQPELYLTPPTFDFGSVVIGTTSSPATFTVQNIGTAPLTLTGEAIHGLNPAYFGIDTDNCDSVTLAPTATCTILVVFHPNSTALRSARLDVSSNDPNVGTSSAALQGTGVAAATPDVSLTPASNDFGQVKIGQTSAPFGFTLTNNGLGTLNITDISLGGASPAWYTLGTTTCAATLAPGLSCTINVSFSPIGNGIKTATLKVTTNDPDSPLVSSTLSGTSECTTNCYVDGVSGNDANGGTSTSDAFKTIQMGVSVVDTGGTVHVAAATYSGSVLINRSMTVVGAGATTVLDGVTDTGDGIAIRDASGVTISNLKVTNFDRGITLGIGGSTAASNITLNNLTVVDNGNHGLMSGTFDLNGLTVNGGDYSSNGIGNVNNNGRGIWLIDGHKSNIDIHGATVNNNQLVGIDISDGDVTGLSIANNTVTGNGDSGIGVLGAEGPGTTLVDNNTVTNNGRYGIEIKVPNGSGADTGPGSIVVSNNTVSRSVAATDARDYAGIAVFRRSAGPFNTDGANGVVVRHNTVSGFRRSTSPVSTGDGFGIVVEGTNMTVDHNTVTNNDVGIQAQQGNTANTQSTPFFDRGNAVSYSGVINRNSISGNTLGLRTAGLSANTDGTCNWWGNASGPSGVGPGTGDTVSTFVTYVPFLSTSNLDQACAIVSVAVNAAALDANGNEGSTLATSGSFSGSVASITSDAADGFVDNGNGTWSWSHLTNDNYSATITVTAHGTNGSTAADVFNATATNVNPTATFNAPASANTSALFNISLNPATDVSSVDAASLHYAFDCGSGYGTALSYATSSATNNTNCTAPGSPGSVGVKGKVWDKDGGSHEYTASVTITNAPAPHLNLTPASNNFGSINTGSSSSAVNFTVKNDGTAHMNLTSETLTGTDPTQFSIFSNSCGPTLAINGTCTVAVKFAPTTIGGKSANLHVVTDGGTADSTLSGTGTTTPTGGDITIKLNTTPDGGSFDFQSATLPSSAYTLTDDGSNDSIAFDSLAAGQYKTQILPKSGWTLDSIVCDSGSWSASLSNKKVTINLVDGDNITCTFSESQPVALPGTPDVMIGTASGGPFSGDNIYSSTVLASQTVNQSIPKNQNKSFWVRLQNDSVNSDSFQINATKHGGPHFTVKIFVNNVDVTSQVTAGTYHINLAGGGSQLIEIRIKATSSVPATGMVDYDLAAISSISGPQDIVRAHATRS